MLRKGKGFYLVCVCVGGGGGGGGGGVLLSKKVNVFFY